MADTIFLIALIAYLGLAGTLVYRSPTHGWGFPMFLFLYPIFLIAFFLATARNVMLVWLGLALVNMVVQLIYMNRVGVEKGIAGVLIAGVLLGSLFLWPVQFAALMNSSVTEQEDAEDQAVQRARIGALPATIKGTVSYAHRHDTEEGHDSVWLEEFGSLPFMTDARTFDRIGISEGKVFSLEVDERDAPTELEVGKVLWILEGMTESQ